MGALATRKSTHISVVVPMTGYALCSGYCYYLLFDEKSRDRVNSEPVKEEIESEVAADADVLGEVRKVAESGS